jgi:hypothetical protein
MLRFLGQVIGWHHSFHARVQTALGDTLIPNYGLKDDGCMSLELWNVIKSVVLNVEGTWVVNLKPGQHVHIPCLQTGQLHIHGVYNHSCCISLNSTSKEEASMDDIAETIMNLGLLLRLSTCGDARQGFIQNSMSLGQGFNALYCAAVEAPPQVIGSLASSIALEDRLNVAAWAGLLEFSLLFLMECRKHAKVKIPGFSNKDIKKKVAALRKALGLAGGENRGIKRKATAV